MIAIALSLCCLPQSLAWSVKRGDLLSLEEARANTPELLQQRGGFDESLLHVAARHGQPGVVDLLLDAGLDANLTTKNGRTPLGECWDQLTASVLLSAGALVDGAPEAQIDVRSQYPPPLWIAVRLEDVDYVELLLDHGANPSQRFGWGSAAPLELATHLGNLELVKTLIDKGADLGDCDSRCGLMWIAATEKRNELVEQLVGLGAPASFEAYCLVGAAEAALAMLNDCPELLELGGGRDGRTPLHWAVRSGDIELVRELILRGANVNERAPTWDRKEQRGCPDFFGSLPSVWGMDPNTSLSDIHGDAPLHDAVRMGDLDMVRLLIEHGALVDAFTEWGLTPLALAATHSRLEVAIELFAAGADVNAYSPPTRGYMSILTRERNDGPIEQALAAVRRMNQGLWPQYPGRGTLADAKQIGQLLIEWGAVPDLLHAAAFGEFELVREILSTIPEPIEINRGADLLDALCLSAISGSRSIGELLIAHGALEVQPPQDTWALTPLHAAIQSGDVEFVRLLIDAGVDVNEQRPARPGATQQRLGLSPVEVAASSDSVEVLKLLLDSGAQLDVERYWCRTPIHDAARAGSLEVLEGFLREGKADFSNRPGGIGILHAAIRAGRVESTRLLLEHGFDPNEPDIRGATPMEVARVGLWFGHDQRDALVNLLGQFGAK